MNEVFKLAKVPIRMEKQIANVDNSTWINENTFCAIKLELVEGRWVRSMEVEEEEWKSIDLV